MDTNISQQLLIEIKKLKEKDYTSYQNFYDQTSQYLYSVLWDSVQNQEIADALLKELYTDIYASIGEELVDDTQFYTWAGNKAKTISFTYLSNTNEIVDKENYHEKEIVAVAAANAIFDAATPAGTSVAGEVVTGEAAGVGIGATAGGYASAGIGAMSFGTKIAIGIAVAALAIGGGIAAFILTHTKDKISNSPTEMINTSTEVVATVTDLETTEDVTEMIVEETTEETPIDERTATYKSYYDIMLLDDSIVYSEIMDFYGDGTEILFLVKRNYEDALLVFDFELYDGENKIYTRQVKEISEGHCQMDICQNLIDRPAIHIWSILERANIQIVYENQEVKEYTNDEFESKYGINIDEYYEQARMEGTVQSYTLLLSAPSASVYPFKVFRSDDLLLGNNRTKLQLMGALNLTDSEEWREKYKTYLNNNPGEYAFFDITGDGIPELIRNETIYSCNRYGTVSEAYGEILYVNKENGTVICTKSMYDDPSKTESIMVMIVEESCLICEGYGAPWYDGGYYVFKNEEAECSDEQFAEWYTELLGGYLKDYRLDINNYDTFSSEQIINLIDEYVVR